MPQALKGLSFVVVGVGMTHDWAKLDLIDSGWGPAGSVLWVLYALSTLTVTGKGPFKSYRG